MKSLKRPIIFCLALLLCLAGCAPLQQEHLQDFISEINESRKTTLAPWTQAEIDLLKGYTAPFEEELDDITPEELDDLLFIKPAKDTVTLEEALSDVDLFFRLLKTTYGPYIYFGGDELFSALEIKVIEQLRTMTTVTSNELTALLSKELSPFIRDGHFIIGNTVLLEKEMLYTYYVEDMFFDNPSDANIDSRYIKRTIAPNGALCYMPVALSKDGADLPASIQINEEDLPLTWTRMQTYTIPATEASYELDTDSEIPVLSLRTLIYSEPNLPIMNKFIASGAQLSGSKVLILDIRGNGGGNSGFAWNWLSGFTNQYMRIKYINADKFSQPYLSFAQSSDEYPDEHIKIIKDSLGTWRFLYQNGAQIPNASIIFVLTDKHVGSSGETFVEYLSALENVVFVGSNTHGRNQFGNVCYFFYLPNTGIRIGLATKFMFTGSLENIDGVGHTPDLWINPATSLDSVRMLCEYYGLP